MPIVAFEGRTTECAVGTRLRDALLDAGQSPHHRVVAIANCHGLGTCGTCAVEVRAADGAVTPPTSIERWRLSFPPHRPDRGLRLACQCRVLGDVEVVKHAGVWGQDRAKAEPRGDHGESE